MQKEDGRTLVQSNHLFLSILGPSITRVLLVPFNHWVSTGACVLGTCSFPKPSKARRSICKATCRRIIETMTYTHRASRLYTLFWMDTSLIHPYGNIEWARRPSKKWVVSPTLGRSRVEAQVVQTNGRSMMPLPSGRLQRQEMFLLYYSIRRVFTGWSERLIKGSSKTRASTPIHQRRRAKKRLRGLQNWRNVQKAHNKRHPDATTKVPPCSDPFPH